MSNGSRVAFRRRKSDYIVRRERRQHGPAPAICYKGVTCLPAEQLRTIAGGRAGPARRAYHEKRVRNGSGDGPRAGGRPGGGRRPEAGLRRRAAGGVAETAEGQGSRRAPQGRRAPIQREAAADGDLSSARRPSERKGPDGSDRGRDAAGLGSFEKRRRRERAGRRPPGPGRRCSLERRPGPRGNRGSCGLVWIDGGARGRKRPRLPHRGLFSRRAAIRRGGRRAGSAAP